MQVIVLKVLVIILFFETFNSKKNCKLEVLTFPRELRLEKNVHLNKTMKLKLLFFSSLELEEYLSCIAFFIDSLPMLGDYIQPSCFLKSITAIKKKMKYLSKDKVKIVHEFII